MLDSQEQTLHADLSGRQAALELARTNLGFTRIVAPQDGIVGERKVRAGQLVSPGTQILSLVENQIWVQANYRETQLLRIRPGDRAEIRVDALPGLVLKGYVEEIAPASGSQFALLPPDNATGNFTKVTQRVPVKIVFDDRPERDGTIATWTVRGRLCQNQRLMHMTASRTSHSATSGLAADDARRTRTSEYSVCFSGHR